MKRLSLLLLFYGCVFISAGCSFEKERRGEPKLALKQVDSVVLEQGKPLFGKFYEQLRITEDGQYWLFSDRIQHQVFVFNKDGSLYSVIGKEGKGPKGILDITGYDVNEKDEVFIYDSAQRMLKIFNLEGELLQSTNFLEHATFNPTANNLRWYNGQVVATIYDTEVRFETQDSRLVSLINTDGSPDTVFGKFDSFSTEDNKLTFNSVIASDKDKDLLFSNLQTSPYFQVHDLSSKQRVVYAGEQTENFKIPSKEIKANLPISEKLERSANTSAIAHIFLTDRYVIQHMQVLTEEWFDAIDYSKKKNALRIYDRNNYELIQEIFVPNTPVSVHNNRLYVIEDFNPDNYTIGIYELVEEKGSIKEN